MSRNQIQIYMFSTCDVCLHDRLDEIYNHLGDRTLIMHEGVLSIGVNEVISLVCAEHRIQYS